MMSRLSQGDNFCELTDFSLFDTIRRSNQRTNGPVNAHLISWPSKAQNIQNLENIWFKK